MKSWKWPNFTSRYWEKEVDEEKEEGGGGGDDEEEEEEEERIRREEEEVASKLCYQKFLCDVIMFYGSLLQNIWVSDLPDCKQSQMILDRNHE